MNKSLPVTKVMRKWYQFRKQSHEQGCILLGDSGRPAYWQTYSAVNHDCLHRSNTGASSKWVHRQSRQRKPNVFSVRLHLGTYVYHRMIPVLFLVVYILKQDFCIASKQDQRTPCRLPCREDIARCLRVCSSRAGRYTCMQIWRLSQLW